MKFMHLGDLHIGKRLNRFPLIEDQRHVLDEITEIARDQQVDAVLVAGDVYDRPTPPVQAVELADSFITSLVEAGIKVFIIGGNHDSVTRLAFASSITRDKGLYIARPFAGRLEWVDLEERAGGRIRIHLLPFVTPFDVRRFFEGVEISTYDEAVAAVLGRAELGEGCNVLVAHQLVLGGGEVTRSDSEQISIGGIDEVSASRVSAFDYVALGHLHAPQYVTRGQGGHPAGMVRYCGSPLKYSFSEMNQRKSVSILSIGEGLPPSIEEFDLHPLHDMREVRGTAEEIRGHAEDDPSLANCYVRAVLTEPVVNARAKMEDLFPLLMRNEFDYGPGEHRIQHGPALADSEKADPAEVFASLFTSINGRPMNDAEEETFGAVLQKLFQAGGDEGAGAI